MTFSTLANIQYSRLKNKIITGPGSTPTIPVVGTAFNGITEEDYMVLNQFTDTDILDGELIINTTDDRVWVRSDDSLLELRTLATASGLPPLTQNNVWMGNASNLATEYALGEGFVIVGSTISVDSTYDNIYLESSGSNSALRIGSGTASGNYSVTSGGLQNTSSGNYSSIGGGLQNTSSGNYSSIGGGQFNTINSGYSSIVSGVSQSVSSLASFIGNGISNHIDNNSNYSNLVGGFCSSITNSNYSNLVGGCSQSLLNSQAGFIGGGFQNSLVSSNCGFIGGGCLNTSNANYTTIGGGLNNKIGILSISSVINGGESNEIGTDGSSSCSSIINGGRFNDIKGSCSIVHGGYMNTITGIGSSILGGGSQSLVGNYSSSVGHSNDTDGDFTYVNGSSNNVIGDFNFISGTSHTVNGNFISVLGQNIVATFSNHSYVNNLVIDELPTQNDSNSFLLARNNTTGIIEYRDASSISGGGGGTVSLQDAYDNSTNPEILTSDGLGALTIKRGTTGGDDDVIFEGQNGAGSVTSEIRANGNSTFSGTMSVSGGITVSGDITVTGTVDGVDISTLVSLTDGDKGDVTVSGSGTTWTIDNNVVTNAKLADMTTNRFKGRITSGTGDPEDLTAAQATSMLQEFNTSNQGVVPASGGGTINFLRADGSWVSPKPTLNKTLLLDTPTASDDITIFRTDVAITVQEVIAVSTGTTPSTTYVLRHSTDRSAAGNLLTNSGTTTSITTGDIASLNDATIPADSWVWFESTAASGTDVILSIDIRYTED